MIPGLVGDVILATRILRIYGDAFTQGHVLVMLIVANLIVSYQNQLLNALGAIDRPDLSIPNQRTICRFEHTFECCSYPFI